MTTKSGPAGADIPGARPTEKGGTLWTPREYRKPHRDDHDHQGQIVVATPRRVRRRRSTRFTSAAVALLVVIGATTLLMLQRRAETRRRRRVKKVANGNFSLLGNSPQRANKDSNISGGYLPIILHLQRPTPQSQQQKNRKRRQSV